MSNGMVAALYVETNGVYYGLPGVDPWDEARDARKYAGPWPVVAHPPCARWCALAGFVEHVYGYKRGDDGGCFAAALDAVHRFGGVLEHPANSQAWAHFGLPHPTVNVGWTLDLYGGASCVVDQGAYGLPIPKRTWLYAYGVELPTLDFRRMKSPPKTNGHPEQLNWNEPRQLADFWRGHRHDGMRARTPPAFRDVLLDMARSAQKVAA